MSSMKCPQCGLINWATAEACKRCKLQLNAPEPEESETPDAPAPRADAQAPQAEGDGLAHSGANGTHAETAAGNGNDGPPPRAHDTQPPHAHDAPPPAYTRADPWRSPYDLGGAGGAAVPGPSLDIDFEVAPFVDTAMTIRDTYALSRSQFSLIARVVLTAIAPHALLILAFGTGFGQGAAAGLPVGKSFFGAPPVPVHGGADFAGVFSFFMLMLIAYHFVRWAVMPSALIYGLVASLNTGETPGLMECYRWGMRRSVSGGFALLLSVVLSFVGLIFLVAPGVFLAICFMVVMPVAAIEGCGAVETLRRSWDLTRGRRATIFFSTFAWGVLVFLFTFVTSLLVALVAGVLRSSVIGSIAMLAVTELLGATGIVLSLVIYLGIARYNMASGGGGEYVPPVVPPSGDAGGFNVPAGNPHAVGFDAHPAGGGWEPQPAFAAPGGFAPARGGGGSVSRNTILILVACGLLVMVVFMAIVAAIAVPNLFAARRAANEASAIANMRELVSAQETHFSVEDRYGDLDELSRRKLINKKVAGGESNGYKFEVRVVGGSFEATATPVKYGSTGTRSFYASSDGVIRVADHRGLKARADDMPLVERTLGSPKGRRPKSEVIIDPGGQVSWPGVR